MFPDDDTAERWFEEQRWPEGPVCPNCGCMRAVRSTHPTMPLRCKDCRKHFSVKKGTVMESSKLGFQAWAIVTYMATTNLKGVSSMKVHRELGITQKAAWHMIQRVREAFVDNAPLFVGTVEVDETVYTDDHKAYKGLKHFYAHETVKHSASEYVRGQVHTNGIESFWATLKRGITGVYHHVSVKHLHRYINEFSGRYNIRGLDTLEQMSAIVRGMDQKRLRYADLIA